MGDNLTTINLGNERTATAIAAGSNHTCAILDNESIKCWGSNAAGQLGVGHTNNWGDNSSEMGNYLLAVDLGSGIKAKAIAAGNQHTCAILDNSSIKCWGANASGQLGLGDTNNRGDESASGRMGDLLDAVDLGTGRTARGIAAGDNHTCAMLDNASVKCWGENSYGQLGQGDKDNRGDGSASGGMGDSLPAVELGSGRTATSITIGTGYTCVLLDDNSVKCWGRGDFGQLGNEKGATRGDEEDEMGDLLEKVYLDGVTVATAIAAGNFHTCAILDNSSIKCWGLNDSGQLGIVYELNHGDANNLQYLDRGSEVDLGAGRTARGIAAGDSHTCAMLDNASIKCWGGNAFGQLGLGHTYNRGDNSSEMGDSLPVISL